ncbi:MAG: hypothetical protein AAF921_13530 [Cyanobacteria bacterium P01_D01_bin.44]
MGDVGNGAVVDFCAIAIYHWRMNLALRNCKLTDGHLDDDALQATRYCIRNNPANHL